MKKLKIIYIIFFCFVTQADAQFVGVGNTNPTYMLDISNRVRIRGGGTLATTSGIWFNNVNNTILHSFMGVMDDNHIGLHSPGPTGWNFVMNVNNGNTGIGTISPAYKLDVGDRMRIRNGVSGTAGLYLNKADNTGERAFIGMKDDSYVGLFGIPLNSWGFLMNTSSGNVALGNTSSIPQAPLHIVRGQKTNGNLHPTSALIVEGDQGGWVQLSNNNNVEGGILSGNQQTFIRGAVVFGMDSSLQFRAGGNFTRLTIDKTGNVSMSEDLNIAGNTIVSGNSTISGTATIGTANISGAATITGSTVMAGSATVVGTANFSSNANISGNVVVTGEVRRTITGSANLVPLAYGTINSVGTILAGTSNFTIDRNFVASYVLAVNGESINTNTHIINLTPISSDARFITAGNNGSGTSITIRTFNSFGLDIDNGFHFVIYKP